MEIEIPAKFDFLFKPKRYKAMFGGRGCVHGNTIIDTPNGGVAIKDFIGGLIYSWNGKEKIITYAGRPVLYSPEQLFKVLFSDGTYIETTANHRLMTSLGWRTVASVCDFLPLSVPIPQVTTSDIDLLESDADVRHCLEKLVSFLYYYWQGYYQYDEQPLEEVNTYLDVLQQLAYEQPRIFRTLTQKDATEFLHKDDLLPLSLHLSSLASVHEVGEKSSAKQGNCISDISSELLSVSYQLSLLSREKNNLHEQAQKLSLLVLACDSLSSQVESLQIVSDILQSYVGDNPCVDSFRCNHVHYSTKDIISIEKTEVCEFYDIFVPFYNNYLVDGVPHHNSGKSHSIVRALLVMGMQKPMRIVCAREIQKSIKDSVHRLIGDVIKEYGLNSFYEVLDTEIRGKNGTLFIFRGLKHNTRDLKSLEGCDICWIEEAENVSDNSYEILIPTIRKDGSEIWVSFNVKNVNDPTYKRFVATHDDDIISVKVSWRDNPFFPEVLAKEKDKLQREDPEAYMHVWEGEPDTRRSGAVYAKQLNKAREEGRITTVPYDPVSEVFTAWDLGFGDSTAIWFCQFVGRELRWIDYYENNGEQLDHYVKVIKSKPYNYVRNGHFLPHDGGHGNIRGDSVSKQLAGMGVLNRVLERENDINVGIETLRQTISYSVFDDTKCSDGLLALDNYAYEWDEERRVFKSNPKHDWTSHASDAARYAAIASGIIKNSVSVTKKTVSIKPKHGWMGY